jgi:predicted ester cyclase
MSKERNVAVLEQAKLAWNAGHLEDYLRLYDPKVMLQGYPGVAPGLEGVRAFYQTFFSAFPGSQLSFEDILSDGDKVAVRFTVRGAHRGEFQGMAPTGKAFSVGGITILRFEDGRCIERWSQADFLGLLQQLGAAPVSA